MIGLLLPFWMNLGGGGAPAPPVLGKTRQQIGEIYIVQQAFGAVVECRQLFSLGTPGAEQDFDVFTATQVIE